MGLPTRTSQDNAHVYVGFSATELAAELLRRAEHGDLARPQAVPVKLAPDDELERRRDAVVAAAVAQARHWERLGGLPAGSDSVPRDLRAAVEALREYAPAEIVAPADPNLRDVRAPMGLDAAEEVLRSPWAVELTANARAELHTLCPLPWRRDRRGEVRDARGGLVGDVTGAATVEGDERAAELLVQVVNGLEAAPAPAGDVEDSHGELRTAVRHALGRWHADRGEVTDVALVEYVQDAVRAAEQAGTRAEELRAELAGRLDELHVVRAELAATASERAAARMGREHAERVTAELREQLARVRNALATT